MTTRNDGARRRAIDRRKVLAGGLSLFGAGVFAGRVRAAGLPVSFLGTPGRAEGRVLVLVQLSGGNDGLSTVVPYGDDGYGRARQALRIDAREVLRLDGYRGLHPALGGLRATYEAGRLAIVEGVGYPGPVRSHFKSMDVWHAASELGRLGGEGWVGRLCSALPHGGEPELTVHVGAHVPYSLYSRSHSPVAFETAEAYRWYGAEEQQQAYAQAARARNGEAEDGSVLERLRARLRDAQDSSARVRRAVGGYRPNVQYPEGAFGGGMRAIAALIDARVGARALSIELPGFDTHQGQRGAHDGLMRTLDAGLTAFLRDLRGRRTEKDVLILTISEFGRRVRENGSAGTDHGKAAPLFVAGAGVQGGLYGRHPSLSELDEGDLNYTTDFRSVYATVIERWFGVSSREVLGADYPLLPLLAHA